MVVICKFYIIDEVLYHSWGGYRYARHTQHHKRDIETIRDMSLQKAGA